MIAGRKNICATQVNTPRIGTSGTHGVRNDRGALGSVRRSTSTPTQTSEKASSVPMETSSPRMLSGKSPEMIAQAMPVIQVVTWGVPYLGWILAKLAGSRPSLAIAKKMRGWPSSETRMTEVRPASVAASMR